MSSIYLARDRFLNQKLFYSLIQAVQYCAANEDCFVWSANEEVGSMIYKINEKYVHLPNSYH